MINPQLTYFFASVLLRQKAVAFLLYLFRLQLKTGAFLTVTVAAQVTALLHLEVASAINWARSAKPNYWHCHIDPTQELLGFCLVVWFGFF